MNRRIRTALTLAACATLYGTTWGQTTFNWNNAGGGSFHTAGNWTPAGGPPGNNDTAQFNLAGSHTVTFAQSNSNTGNLSVRQGIITFTAANATASHTWSDTGIQNIGPLSGDAATEARVILRDMTDTMTGWGTLQIGSGAGKSGILEVRNAQWSQTGFSTTELGNFGGSGNGEIRLSQGGSFYSHLIRQYNGTITVGTSGSNSTLGAFELRVLGGELRVNSSNQAFISDLLLITDSSPGGSNAYVVGQNASIELAGFLGSNRIVIGTGDIFSGGKGTLSVQAGASVLAEGTLQIGSNPSNSSSTVEGDLLVTGTAGTVASSVTIGGVTTLGEGGQGRIRVLQGGRFNGNELVAGLNSTVQSEFLVQDANSLANVTTVSVGQNANGLLRVMNGGRLNLQSAVIGSASGDATLNVSGTNSLMFATGNVTLGDTNANTSATIQSSGRLNVLDTITIGNAGGSATVSVTSAGQLNVGNIIIGTASDNSTGSLTVSGTNSLVNLTGTNSNTYVGRLGGTGTLNVNNNASFGDLDASIRLGSGVSSSNVGTSGVLNVSSGGTVQARDLNVGESFGNGHVSLSGSNTSIEVADYLWLGFNFLSPSNVVRGTVLIDDSAMLTANRLILGSSNQDNRITVRNGGRLTINDTVEIGQQRGTLIVESGGRFQSNGGIIGSRDDDFYTGLGAVSVSGASSLWNALGTNALDVGKAGIGMLEINQGAAVQATYATIGGYGGGAGNVTLTGNSSALTVSGTLGIGGTTVPGGIGSLNINPGSNVTVGGTVSLWATGTVNLNGGTFTLPVLNAQSGLFNWNAGTLIFSQNNTLTNDLLNTLVGSSHVLGQNRTLSSTTGTDLALATNLTVDGGRLNSGGALNINAGGMLIVNNGGQASSTGIITNNGSIILNGLAATMSGNTIDNRGSIRGSGVINNTLSNNTTGQVRVAASDWLTFNGTGHTNLGSVQLLGGVLEFASNLNTGTQGFISGHGTLLTSSGAQGGLGLVNTGTFAFSGGNTNIYGDVQNNTTGRIVTSGGSVTTFHDDVTHNGTELRTSSGSTTVFLGSVSGAGPFTGTGLVQFEGDLRPGNSPANVPFAGDVEFSVTARLVTELGGILPGSEYDRLTVQGQVMLSGQLEVQLINGFVPAAGDLFTIIDNQGSGSVIGTFSGLAEGSSFISNGQLWNITYQGGTGNDVMLMAVPEPTTWALLGFCSLGATGVWWHRRRQNFADEIIIE